MDNKHSRDRKEETIPSLFMQEHFVLSKQSRKGFLQLLEWPEIIRRTSSRKGNWWNYWKRCRHRLCLMTMWNSPKDNWKCLKSPGYPVENPKMDSSITMITSHKCSLDCIRSRLSPKMLNHYSLFNQLSYLCFPDAIPPHYPLGSSCFQKLVKIKKLRNTIRKQAFFLWPDARGDISSKSCVCWAEKSCCL